MLANLLMWVVRHRRRRRGEAEPAEAQERLANLCDYVLILLVLAVFVGTKILWLLPFL